MNVGLVSMRIRLFGINSIKEKRSIVKRLTSFIRKKYNVSVSEVGYQDSKDFLELALAMVSNDRDVIHNVFQSIADYIELSEGLEIEEMEKELW